MNEWPSQYIFVYLVNILTLSWLINLQYEIMIRLSKQQMLCGILQDPFFLKKVICRPKLMRHKLWKYFKDNINSITSLFSVSVLEEV